MSAVGAMGQTNNIGPFIGTAVCAVSNYISSNFIVEKIETNYTREAISIGTRSTSCSNPGCCVYHFEYVYSPTDYYEIEKVVEKSILKYDVDGIKGETCVKERELSTRKREVRQAVTTIMKTNDWQKVVVFTNIVGYASHTTNWVTTNALNCIGYSSITNLAVLWNVSTNK